MKWIKNNDGAYVLYCDGISIAGVWLCGDGWRVCKWEPYKQLSTFKTKEQAMKVALTIAGR